MRAITFGIAVTGTISLATPSIAQYILDTKFCTAIQGHRCVGGLASGTTVSLGSIRPVRNDEGKTERRIHFWVALKSEVASDPILYMTREGSCYQQEDKLEIKQDPTFLETAGSYVKATGQNILESLDLTATVTLGIFTTTIKKKDVSVPAGVDRFRIYAYRAIYCPGTVRARAIDSEGRPIAGSNTLRIVQITE
jgi:hypothetical protein